MSRAREDTLFLPGSATDHLDTIPLLPALDDAPRSGKVHTALQRARTVVLREPARAPEKPKVVARPKPLPLPKRAVSQPSPARRRQHWTTLALAVTVLGLWAYVMRAIFFT